jgi:hypothetical protein
MILMHAQRVEAECSKCEKALPVKVQQNLVNDSNPISNMDLKFGQGWEAKTSDQKMAALMLKGWQMRETGCQSKDFSSLGSRQASLDFLIEIFWLIKIGPRVSDSAFHG